MDPREAERLAEVIYSWDELEAMIGGPPAPAWALACQFRGAHDDVPAEEWRAVKKDTWTDEGEEWALYLNGSGEAWYPTVSPIGDDYPDPAAVEVFSGAHLITVDEEAIAILHPDHLEFFCDEDVTKSWETAVLHALRDRLVDLGEDIPHVDELAKSLKKKQPPDAGGDDRVFERVVEAEEGDFDA
ncbi:MAG: hypothetical protein ACOCY7_01370 [Halodesulfurarchaeum sp.]